MKSIAARQMSGNTRAIASLFVMLGVVGSPLLYNHLLEARFVHLCETRGKIKILDTDKFVKMERSIIQQDFGNSIARRNTFLDNGGYKIHNEWYFQDTAAGIHIKSIVISQNATPIVQIFDVTFRPHFLLGFGIYVSPRNCAYDSLAKYPEFWRRLN